MTTKLLMAGTALTLFAAALVLPAAALASPVVTENGVAVVVGKKFTITQVGTSKSTNTEGTQNLFECTKVTMTGEFIKNSGTEIEAKITKAEFGGTGPQAMGEPNLECTGEIGGVGNVSITAVVSAIAPWCLKSINPPKDEFTIIGGACGGVAKNLKFITAFTSIATFGNCEYESTGHLVGTYMTNGTSTVLALTNAVHSGSPGEGSTDGFKRIAGNPFCLTSFSYDTIFTLETDGEKAEPLIIS